jgi:hypothetical protein
MTLLSPGVQVSVIDQSNYSPAASGSIPYFLIATAQNKISGAGTGVAPGTLAANANKLYLMTSQRDLLSTYGNPFFYNTTAGTPINGYELNEYGLLAAYSALGVTNQAYVQRVDIDLAALTATLTRPTGAPNNGTYWLNTTSTKWGLQQWNITTGAFTNQVPSVITSTNDLESGSTVPLQSYGSIGQYAVVATATTNPIYYKRGGPTSTQAPAWLQDSYSADELYNSWVLLGSDEWKTAWATVQGTTTPTSLVAGTTLIINNQTITVSNTVGQNTVNYLVAQINNSLNSSGVYAANIGGSLNLYADSTAVGDTVTVTGGTNNGTTTTLTFAAQATAPYVVGDSIVVSGLTSTGAGWNGTQVVTDCTTTTVSFASTNAGPYVSGGSISEASGQANGGIIYISGGTALTQLGLTVGEYYAPQYNHGPSYQAPRWRSSQTMPAPTGSVFQQTNSVNLGATLVISRYNSTLGTFVLQACPIYNFDTDAIYGLDPTTGGAAIPVGTTYAQPDPYNNSTGGMIIRERYASGATIITATNTNPTFTSGSTFQIRATEPETSPLTSPVTATILGTTAADFVSAVSAAGVPNVSATIGTSGALVLTHATGGDIQLLDGTHNPIATAGFTPYVNASTPYSIGVTYRNLTNASAGYVLSNWAVSPTFTYVASAAAPDQAPATGTYWYYSDATVADIMIQNNGAWIGYQNCMNDVRGYDLSLTNAAGPIFSATAPMHQTNAAQSVLQYGDLWIDTSDLENYPLLNRWENINGQDQWVLINNTDQTTINGVLFADARWAPNGTTDPITAPLPPISGPGGLITSDYLDLDAPNPALYPEGMLLWNTRRSGFNVKSFEANAFNATDYPYPDVIPEVTSTWNTASGNRANGSPHMGHWAQRAIIVKALKAGIDSNTQVLENQVRFNLMATPSYPELAPDMVTVNDNRGETAFIVVDTPLRLTPEEVVTWATNNNGLGVLNGDGNQVFGQAYAGAFYPSCQTTDLAGSLVVTAPSHMMIRTIIRSDAVSYPWFAPAGLRRGVVDNAVQIGYINSTTGKFVTTTVNQGLRDVLYQNNVNPITFIPGSGITNFGNHTLHGTNTALDRINVARLVAYLRAQLELIGNQYLFEPNDTITRSAITGQITSLMNALVSQRGIYDYLVVCDLSNNTPATIDANELYVDIAIEPEKAVEFIYIPMRIQNTGTIASQKVA